MKSSIFIRTEYGVVVELRHWNDGVKWLDCYGSEWKEEAYGWVSAGWSPTRANEIGRWTGEDIYKVVQHINDSGFRNYGG